MFQRGKNYPWLQKSLSLFYLIILNFDHFSHGQLDIKWLCQTIHPIKLTVLMPVPKFKYLVVMEDTSSCLAFWIVTETSFFIKLEKLLLFADYSNKNLIQGTLAIYSGGKKNCNCQSIKSNTDPRVLYLSFCVGIFLLGLILNQPGST